MRIYDALKNKTTVGNDVLKIILTYVGQPTHFRNIHLMFSVYGSNMHINSEYLYYITLYRGFHKMRRIKRTCITSGCMSKIQKRGLVLSYLYSRVEDFCKNTDIGLYRATLMTRRLVCVINDLYHSANISCNTQLEYIHVVFEGRDISINNAFFTHLLVAIREYSFS